MQACKKQLAIMSGFKTDPSKSINRYLEFKFDNSRKVSLDVEVTTTEIIGWDIVHNNTTEV